MIYSIDTKVAAICLGQAENLDKEISYLLTTECICELICQSDKMTLKSNLSFGKIIESAHIMHNFFGFSYQLYIKIRIE